MYFSSVCSSSPLQVVVTICRPRVDGVWGGGTSCIPWWDTRGTPLPKRIPHLRAVRFVAAAPLLLLLGISLKGRPTQPARDRGASLVAASSLPGDSATGAAARAFVKSQRCSQPSGLACTSPAIRRIASTADRMAMRGLAGTTNTEHKTGVCHLPGVGTRGWTG